MVPLQTSPPSGAHANPQRRCGFDRRRLHPARPRATCRSLAITGTCPGDPWRGAVEASRAATWAVSSLGCKR